MAADTCFICEEPFAEDEKTTTPQRRGIETLINASKERKDNKSYKYKLKDKECVTIHEKCYKSYTHPSNIKAHKKRQNFQVGSTSTRATFVAFEFDQNCLFCGKDASEKFLKNQAKLKNTSKRQGVSKVSAEETHNNILRRASERSDKWGSEVLDRVASVASLISVQARYHGRCYLRFFKLGSKIGNDESSGDVPRTIDLIQRFIKDNPDEDNFSLQQIIDRYEGKAAENQWPKMKLYERLCDDITIASNKGSEPIIYLRDTRHRILLKNFEDSQNEEFDRIEIVSAAAKIITEDIQAQDYDVETYPSPNCFFENVEKLYLIRCGGS